MTSGKKYTIEEAEEILSKASNGNLTIDRSTYIDTQHRSRFFDKDYGEWWTTLNLIISNNRKHPKRALEEKKQTCMKNYGVENPMHSEEIKERFKKTNLERYGVENPMQNEQFKKNHQNALMEKYGVDNPMKNAEIALRSAINRNNSGIIKHWKTNEDCVWVGSYERKTLEYLNKNQIDYSWQPEVFTMPNGKTYRPDLYLIKENLYIEIKRLLQKRCSNKMAMVSRRAP